MMQKAGEDFNNRTTPRYAENPLLFCCYVCAPCVIDIPNVVSLRFPSVQKTFPVCQSSLPVVTADVVMLILVQC